MDTIFRLKRRRDEEPSEALLVTCKRAKKSDDGASVSALLKFAGTVDKKSDNVKEHVPEKSTKEGLKSNFRQHVIDTRNKLRKKNKERISENRLKVVNSKRDIVEENLKIIDIEDANPCKTGNTDPSYVYDLYFSNTDEDLPLDNLESIETVNDELVFDDYHKDDEEGYNSDDSNAESNWRNDYPDSEDDTFGGEYINNAMKSMNLEQYSSDEDFVYGFDEDDVERCGHKYAKYKARIKRENEGHYDSDSQEDDSDDNEDYGDDDFNN